MSLAAGCLCGLVPYVLFRARAMGGGDVKLFAALGAVTGYDLFVGLRIELAAFATALIAVLWSHARAQRLSQTLRSSVHTLLRRRTPDPLGERNAVNVRLGRFVFVATALHVILPLAGGSTS